MGEQILNFIQNTGSYIAFAFPIFLLLLKSIIEIPFIKKQIDSFLDRYFQLNLEKDLEKFRAELNNSAELFKHDINRKFVDFNLFTSKKHEVYSSLYQLILEAKSAVANLEGFMRELTFEEFNEEDLRNFLVDNRVPQGKQDEFITDFFSSDVTRNREEVQREIHGYIREIYTVPMVNNKIIEAKNYCNLKALFLSDNVEKITHSIIKNLLLLKYYKGEFPPNNQNQAEDKARLEASIDSDFVSLKKLMKKEISVGYYSESDMDVISDVTNVSLI